ncbi:MAG: phosphatidylserine decarboxylase family protein [Deltaproteobacteria bacterium]
MKHDSIIAKEGYPFILISLVLTILISFSGICLLIILMAAITFFIVWFFRNPERSFRDEEKLVISPADGKVIKIENVDMKGTIAGKFKKISIFMNVLSVHVNRAPYPGKIEKINYHKGKFFSANLDKASKDNERNEVMIRTEDGREIWVVQIAGLIARRIVCWINIGTKVLKGERFGLIRFGSRVDVYLPEDSKISVNLGDKVRAGKSTLGYLS